MQADVDTTLRNLGVLAAIKQNDKLITEGDFFTIYTPTTFRAFWRMYYRENREQNVQRVSSAMRNARAFLTSVLTDYGQQDDDSSETIAYRLHKATQIQMCGRLMHALADSMVGLNNLCETYVDDAAIVVKIRQLKQENTDFMQSTRRVGTIELPLIESVRESTSDVDIRTNAPHHAHVFRES